MPLQLTKEEILGLPKICKECGNTFTDRGANGGRRTYCSTECSRLAGIRRNREKAHIYNPGRTIGLNTGETGQINEMLVAIKLMKDGYKIYIPFDTTCSHDLLALKNGIYYKVQVKTGIYMGSGNKQTIKPKNNDYHFLAVVYNLGEEIEIIPNL